MVLSVSLLEAATVECFKSARIEGGIVSVIVFGTVMMPRLPVVSWDSIKKE